MAVALLAIAGCATTGGASKGELSYRFVGETKVTGAVSTFTYEYSIDQGEPRELAIWTKEDTPEGTVITVGSSQPNITNKFIYRPLLTGNNFFYPLRDGKEYVLSLPEAVERALVLYLENN